jgi:hypothetical protein
LFVSQCGINSFCFKNKKKKKKKRMTLDCSRQ